MKMKKIIKKKFSKKKKNLDIIIFEIVDVKNSNAKIFMKYYIDDTTTISNNFTKFFFKFENFLKKDNATQTQKKEQKEKKNSKKKTKTRASRRRRRRKQMSEFLYFI